MTCVWFVFLRPFYFILMGNSLISWWEGLVSFIFVFLCDRLSIFCLFIYFILFSLFPRLFTFYVPFSLFLLFLSPRFPLFKALNFPLFIFSFFITFSLLFPACLSQIVPFSSFYIASVFLSSYISTLPSSWYSCSFPQYPFPWEAFYPAFIASVRVCLVVILSFTLLDEVVLPLPPFPVFLSFVLHFWKLPLRSRPKIFLLILFIFFRHSFSVIISTLWTIFLSSLSHTNHPSSFVD